MRKYDENEIQKLMTNLEITREEAMEMIDFDNDEFELEEVDEMTAKAKEINRAERMKENASKPRKKVERERKVNNEKAELVEMLLGALELFGIENAEVTKVEKLVEFSYKGKNFKFDLVQKREPKVK